MMRPFTALALLLTICGCQQKPVVPTAQQLVANPALLTEWQEKCNSGENSQIAPAQKSNLCSTTQQATISVAQRKAARETDDFYEANTLRKK